jgi:peptidoglycan/LPS O-acetylase OafA/YrhL
MGAPSATLVTQDRKIIPALTSIRFFAAVAVMMFHSGAGFSRNIGLPQYLVNALDNGYLGVTLFFVLSGFIITYSHYSDLRRFSIKAASHFYLAGASFF